MDRDRVLSQKSFHSITDIAHAGRFAPVLICAYPRKICGSFRVPENEDSSQVIQEF
jgi:hypothetical protein